MAWWSFIWNPITFTKKVSCKKFQASVKDIFLSNNKCYNRCYNRDLRNQRFFKCSSGKYPWIISIFVVHRKFIGRDKCFYCFMYSRIIQRYLQYTKTHIAFTYLQDNLNLVQNQLRLWRIKVNEKKSIHVTFITCAATYSAIYLNRTQVLQDKDVRYLSMHFDRKFNWKKHICNKRKHLGLKLTKTVLVTTQKFTTVSGK